MLSPLMDRNVPDMGPTDQTSPSPPSTAGRPRWSDVLRMLREARGVTQDGWAARMGVSHKTVQRWERGERAPDPGAEAAILAYCRDVGLFRTFDHGPLAGLALTADTLGMLLAEARWRTETTGVGSRESAKADRNHVDPSKVRVPLPRPWAGERPGVGAPRRLPTPDSRLPRLPRPR
ncbi:MAG: helix-turn-helix transcriptional regulator [Chloroflexi bacterium]|nr:helix-turn-helix transcriptional regulator [Chloroflexota bacterium]